MSDNNDTKIHSDDAPTGESREAGAAQELARPQKPFFQAALPVFACGAGLFSDGYVNNVSRLRARPCRLLSICGEARLVQQ